MKDILEQIIHGRTDLVFDMFTEGRSADIEDDHGRPIIVWCAYHGDVSAIRHLIAHGASLDALGSDFGLNAAAFHGHWQLCRYLLENGADANSALADTGETPLHAALCRANRPLYDHVIEVLLAYGADVNRVTKNGAETGAFMRDCRTRGETPLHRAAAFGTARAIRLLLEAGASREARDANGDSPLSWASWHLRPPAILRMLCYGEFSIHPDNHSTYDHGAGWGQIDAPLRGRPTKDK